LSGDRGGTVPGSLAGGDVVGVVGATFTGAGGGGFDAVGCAAGTLELFSVKARTMPAPTTTGMAKRSHVDDP
jgi:hypothetical protein